MSRMYRRYKRNADVEIDEPDMSILVVLRQIDAQTKHLIVSPPPQPLALDILRTET